MAESSFPLSKTLSKLRKETPRRLQDLRDACDRIGADLADDRFAMDVALFDAPLKMEAAQLFLQIFQQVCASRQSRLIEISLEGVNFLVEYGFFQVESNSDSVEPRTGSVPASLIDSYIELIGKFSDTEYDDVIQLQVIKTLLSSVNSTLCEVHEASLLVAVRTCFHIHLMSKNSVNKNTAKAALTQMLSVVNQRMELVDVSIKESKVVSSSGPNSGSQPANGLEVSATSESDNSTFPSIYHKDSFSIFRALCKLSMKALNDESSSDLDPIALQNKILSLELIHHVLNCCGPAFKYGEKFIYIIRNFLCVSLLSNCTSQVAQVTGLSLQIFVLLLEHFKDHLKSELEVFITGIFLRILESENSSYDHKLKVLEVFHSICRDSSGLVEIFATFDCDMEAIDLFKRIVEGFSKVAKNTSSSSIMSYSSKRMNPDEVKVRSMGLDGLVIVLNSLLKVAGLLDHKIAAVTEHEVDSAAHSRGDAVDETDNADETDALHAVDIFDRKQRIQVEIETGILKFNASAKKGLAYLAGLNHITMTPDSVAKFLLQYQDRLDKTAVGEYLGKEREYENGFCLSVLHAYVDNIDFTGLSFDMAIRHFLAGFRIPGEAQKIDRIMEKFAERYVIQNPEVFATADLAFIFGFSVIMLQTNLHNPAIRDDKRMTKEQFLKQNKGLTPDGEIPDSMLSEIFDRIAATPITIKEDDKVVKKKEESTGFTVFQISPDRRKKDAFNDERKEMVRAGEALIKQLTKKQNTSAKKTITNEQLYARPMFDVIWAPILGVLSQLLEVAEDPSLVSTCLNGFQYGIRLACRLDIPIARETYINSLIKFSTLDVIREMQQKNVECIKTLLIIAISERDYIDESWSQVMRCLSQLSRLQLCAAGGHTDDKFFGDRKSSRDNQESSGSMFGINKFFTGPSRAEIARDVEVANSELVTRDISSDVIDQIFLNSQYLSEESVLYFVKCLCSISSEEINASSAINSYRNREGMTDAATPRIFSLQKLVEVADFNMQCRPRIAWQNMWKLLADHFTKLGTQDNAALAMYAVDSLKQLSIKFLQKEELSNFNFQRLFLKPFEIIMIKSKSPQIKDLVLNCIDVMIRACATNIRSGWKSIFAIFEAASSQPDFGIANIAFCNIERLMGNQFDIVAHDFVELVNCLVVFLNCKHSSLAIKSLDHILLCASRLAEGRIEAISPKTQRSNSSDSSSAISPTGPKEPVVAQVSEDASTFKFWWPLLLGLSTSVSDDRPLVKFKAIETLDSVLGMYGHLFSPQTWSVIFKGVMFPIMDYVKSDDQSYYISTFPSENPVFENAQSIGQSVLQVCQDLYFKYQEKSEEAHLLADLLNMLEGCICHDSEILAKMGLKSFNSLLIRLGQNKSKAISSDNLELISKKLSSCLLSSFTLNFGEVGRLTYIDETPSIVAKIFKECPVSKRRRGREEKISQNITDNCGEVVHTLYGDGRKTHIVPKDEELGLSSRHCLNLTWGGKLYYPVTGDEQAQLDDDAAEAEVPWDELVAPTMTSMVMALESIRVVSDAVSLYLNVFDISQINEILLALETLYWHARSFNACKPLRQALYAKKFMQFPDDPLCLPHLLEQEVFSLSKVLDIVLKLYISSSDAILQSFAEIWVHKMVVMTCTRYLDQEQALKQSLETPDVFQIEQHEAYGAAVLISLHGIVAFSQAQFNKLSPIFLDILAKMTVCDDVDVRNCVSQIYLERVNPMLRNILSAIVIDLKK